jgi:enoyl-CoA hydratase/carnithine racemase
VVSVAKIRGCVRGASSESVLACDMRFASRENTRLGQPEVGVGVHPGGGGTERPPHLVGPRRHCGTIRVVNRRYPMRS